jgi:hypothetical protein
MVPDRGGGTARPRSLARNGDPSSRCETHRYDFLRHFVGPQAAAVAGRQQSALFVLGIAVLYLADFVW